MCIKLVLRSSDSLLDIFSHGDRQGALTLWVNPGQCVASQGAAMGLRFYPLHSFLLQASSVAAVSWQSHRRHSVRGDTTCQVPKPIFLPVAW